MKRRVGIIGAGYVGSIVGYSLAMKGLADEIYFYDILPEKARVLALDLEDGYNLYPEKVRFFATSFEEFAQCQIIVFAFTAGQYARSRLDESEKNKKAMEEMVPNLEQAGFQGEYLIITNPCDIITYTATKISNLAKHKIIGTGTELDNRRCKIILGEKLDFAVDEISSLVLGEHGDSMMIPYSHIKVQNRPLEEHEFSLIPKEEIEAALRFRGNDIYQNKNSTQYGIASVACDMIQAIYQDEKREFLASSYLEGGIFPKPLCLSLPVVIGKEGIEGVQMPPLLPEEESQLLASADVIYGYIE